MKHYETSAQIAAPPEAVWAVLTDGARWSSWDSGVTGVEGRHVYLPTYGGGAPDLAALDAHMAALWEGLGYAVHLLADFGSFARRQGVVHCIKKYLRRGD